MNLRAHGRLTNARLLRQLNVKRSSAVCALLARIPGVEVAPSGPIELRLAGEDAPLQGALG
jgi:hypothetical protein